MNISVLPRSYEYGGLQFKNNNGDDENPFSEIHLPYHIIAGYFEMIRTQATGILPVETSLFPLNKFAHGPFSFPVKSQFIRIFHQQEITNFIQNHKISFSVHNVGKSSLTFRHVLLSQDPNGNSRVLAEGFTTNIYANRIEKKAYPLPDEVRQVALKYAPPVGTPLGFPQTRILPYKKSFAYKLNSNSSSSSSVYSPFTFEFTIMESNQDWWGHTNQSQYVKFFEDTRKLAFLRKFFNNKKFHQLTGRRLASIQVEYNIQTYAGQLVRVCLWPLFDYDLQFGGDFPSSVAQNFTESDIPNHVVGFGGQLEVLADSSGTRAKEPVITNTAYLLIEEQKAKL